VERQIVISTTFDLNYQSRSPKARRPAPGGLLYRAPLYVLAIVSLSLASFADGCATQQATVAQIQPSPAQAAPLPFKGRLSEGDAEEIPPSVAISLSKTSPIAFSYREELTHDERHTPLLLSALDPATYFGATLGEYGVTAFATLSISDGDKVIGYYTAKVRVSQTYNLDSEPTHASLENQARAAVREKIDAQLANDSNRLASAVAGSKRSAGDTAGK